MKIRDIVVFENDDFIVLNKPSGLLSIPDREGKEISLKNLLQENYGNIFTVHRLDRDTSGLIAFAKNETTHKHLSKQFEERSTRKIYNGLVLGKPQPAQGLIDVPIAEHYAQQGKMMTSAKGKTSITEFEVVEQFRLYAWMQFTILTGRTHQIRVHMNHIGHPVACDTLYGDGKPILLSSFKKKFKLSKAEDEERAILNRLALHASELSFSGNDNKVVKFTAEIPKDLKALLQQLRKWNQ